MMNTQTLSFPTPNHVHNQVALLQMKATGLKSQMILLRKQNKPRAHIKAQLSFVNAEIKKIRGY